MTIFHRLFEDQGISRQRLVVGCRGTAFGFLREVESQHPDVVRRPDADAHRGASADQPGQPCATARCCDPSGEIESSVGSGYCNQDRESDLQWIVCTRHGRAGDHWSKYSDVSNYSGERELRFGLPPLRMSALLTIPKPHRCCLDCDIRQRTRTSKGDRSRWAQLPHHF